MPTNPDSIYGILNTPRCKTAVLVMTVLAFAGVVITEIQGKNSSFLQALAMSCFTFWAGRSSKAKDKN